MTRTVAAPPAIDLLGQAVESVRPHLQATNSIHYRIRRFWAGVVVSREAAAPNVIEAVFMRLAQETGLARDLGRHAEEDLRHVIRWGILRRNPFGK
jgi:hypothetical protein